MYTGGCLICILRKPSLVNKILNILSHEQPRTSVFVDLKHGVNSDPVDLSESFDQDMQ